MRRYSSDGNGTPCHKLLKCAITITTRFEQGVHDKELIMIVGRLLVRGVVLLLLPIVTTVTPC